MKFKEASALLDQAMDSLDDYSKPIPTVNQLKSASLAFSIMATLVETGLDVNPPGEEEEVPANLSAQFLELKELLG